MNARTNDIKTNLFNLDEASMQNKPDESLLGQIILKGTITMQKFSKAVNLLLLQYGYPPNEAQGGRRAPVASCR